MARTSRLIELLITIQGRPHFTAAELAEEFGVSRRTMLRDLQSLADLGVPLLGTPGRYGGYELVSRRRLLPLTLTVDEASGMILSYEAFLSYPQSPFAARSLSALTKLRNALPPDVVQELDRIKRHVAVLEMRPQYEAPLLEQLLDAALAQTHLRIVYESRSGRSERVIYPFGLYAAYGFWYCACYDYRRKANVSLRADRIFALERVDGLERPQQVLLETWLRVIYGDDGERLPLRATVTEHGMKSFDLQSVFGHIRPSEEGGVIESMIPPSEIDYYAARFLAAGSDARVESPPELVAAIRRRIRTLARHYGVAGDAGLSSGVSMRSDVEPDS
jgi:predicted DNA-binding transcriptional regulator YafY